MREYERNPIVAKLRQDGRTLKGWAERNGFNVGTVRLVAYRLSQNQQNRLNGPVAQEIMAALFRDNISVTSVARRRRRKS